MNRRHLTGQRLIALFITGCLVLNYPLLSLFSHNGMVGGIPLLYLYVFLCWAGLIVLLVGVIEFRR
jgi:hypothetical protein